MSTGSRAKTRYPTVVKYLAFYHQIYLAPKHRGGQIGGIAFAVEAAVPSAAIARAVSSTIFFMGISFWARVAGRR
jgi:hypothetical protein